MTLQQPDQIYRKEAQKTGTDYSVVGKALPAINAYEKVCGAVLYAGDLMLPNMLYAKVLRSPYARARITSIDSSKAKELPGVEAVITYKNIPQKEWFAPDFNWQGGVMEEIVRFVGDEVAAVAAVDEETAEEALKLIEVEYEQLPAVLHIKQAMEPNSPQVRMDGNMRRPVVIEWGDLEAGFRQADLVVEHETTLGNQQHAPMDRNACLASWTGNELTIWTGTQTLFFLRKVLADYFDLPLGKVRVISTLLGGSFGMWWDNNFHFIPPLLAKKAGKPVKLVLTREEVFSTVKRRESPITYVKLGVKKDGKLTAAYYRHIFDNGGYGNKFDPYQSVADLYRVPNGKYEAIGVSTNRCTAGCARGVGDVTLGYGIEQTLDIVAEKLGLDPVEIRINNIFHAGDELHTTQEAMFSKMLFPESEPTVKLTSSGLEECIRKGATEIGWKRWKGWGQPIEIHGSKRRGLGMAISTHISGVAFLNPSAGIVKVESDGTPVVYTGVGRMGQGAETVLAQIVAEVLGVGLSDVQIVAGDSATAPITPATVGSISTHMVGPVMKEAAEDAKQQILQLASEVLRERAIDLDIKDRRIIVKSRPDRSISLTELLNTRLRDSLAEIPIIGKACGRRPYDKSAQNVMAYFAEVEVDVETGGVKILRFIAVQDAGKIINPGLCTNQVYGGVFMGSGLGLTEDLIFDPETGRILNPNFLDYKILTPLDLPDPEVHFVEEIDPMGPYGAKGIGEAPNCAVAAVISSAVHNAIGVRIDPPVTPDKVIRALHA